MLGEKPSRESKEEEEARKKFDIAPSVRSRRQLTLFLAPFSGFQRQETFLAVSLTTRASTHK